MADVAGLLSQLSKALQKQPTAEVGCQTIESYGNSLLSCYDFTVNEITAYLAQRKRDRGDFQSPAPTNVGKKPRTTPPKTPPQEKLTLMHPPSNPSVCTMNTEDMNFDFQDNVSEPFDENDKSPEYEEDQNETHYSATCPKCGIVAEGYTTVLQVFGWKYNHKNQKTHQSWCADCRHGTTAKQTEAEAADRCFDTDTTIINRRGSFFIVSHPQGGGMNFYDTIKKSNESWKDAEQRHQNKAHPIVQKRTKLEQILSKQEKQSMETIMRKYKDMTTLELFCRIKNETPALLTPLGLLER